MDLHCYAHLHPHTTILQKLFLQTLAASFKSMTKNMENKGAKLQKLSSRRTRHHKELTDHVTINMKNVKISKEKSDKQYDENWSHIQFSCLGAEAAKNALMMSLTGKQPPYFKNDLRIHNLSCNKLT